MSRERNILVGVLAVAAGKAAPEKLNEWSQLPAMDLADRLETEGVLTKDERRTFDQMIDGALQNLGPDAAATIASIVSSPSGVATIASEMPFDSAAAATIQSMPRTPGGTILTGAGSNADKTVLSSPDAQVSLGWKGAVRGDLVPAVQEHLGRYEYVKDIAAGGMGQIVQVHDTHLGRDIAFKTLLSDRFGLKTRAGAPTTAMLTIPIIARFLQEARITGQLEHPAITPVYELGYKDDGTIYYTMKLLRGNDMQKALDKMKTMQERLGLLKNFQDACNALAYAHSRSVIHRDLKPLNIMTGEFGETIVIDWGIAKVKGKEDIHAKEVADETRTLRLSSAEVNTKTMYGQAMGSPFYMPPEQAEGKIDQIDERADVYALGAILYHILAGVPPYHGMGAREFLDKVTQFAPKPILEIEPNAPPELVAICNRAMARKREDRYKNAKDLAKEIETFITGGLVGAYKYSFKEIFWRFVKKNSKIFATAAAAAVLLLAATVYYIINLNIAREKERVAKEQAIKSEKEAITQKGIAVEQKDIAEHNLYFANIKGAQRDIADQRVSQARAAIEQCPEGYRDWEWGHLAATANADLMTLPAGGSFVAFTSDGLRVVSGTPGILGGIVAVTDLRSGKEERKLIENAGDSYTMVSGGNSIAAHHDKGLTVWDPATGKTVFQRDDTGKIEGQRVVALSSDGVYLAALNSDLMARVWRLADGAELFSIKVDTPNGFSVAFEPAPCAHMVVAQTVKGEVGYTRSFAFYSLSDGQKVNQGDLKYPNTAHSMAIAPGAKWLAIGTDNDLQLWNTEDWLLAKSIAVRFDSSPQTIAFNHDGSKAAAGTKDGDLLSIAIPAMEVTKLETAHPEPIRCVTFSNDGAMIISGSVDRSIRLWNAADLRPLETLRGHANAIFALDCNPKAPLLASASFDQTTKIWRLDRDFAHARPEKVATDLVHGVAAGVLAKREIGIWDARTGARRNAMPGHTGDIIALAIDPSGESLATIALEDDAGKKMDVVRLWKAQTGETAGQFSTGVVGITKLTFAGGPGVLAAQAGSKLFLFDTAGGKLLRTIEKSETFAISPDGKRIAVATKHPEKKEHALFTLYATDQEAPLLSDAIESVGPLKLAFSLDGKVLVAGAGVTRPDEKKEGKKKTLGHLYRWEMAENKPLPVLEGHSGSVSSVAFGKDGALASGGTDGSVVAWDLSGNKPALTIAEAHASTVSDIAFNPEATRIVSASLDGTFNLWETKTGRGIFTVQNSAIQQRENALAPERTGFSPDARILLTQTKPVVLAPVLLEAFPWKKEELDKLPGEKLQEKIEAFKRSDRGLAGLLPKQ